MSGLRAGDRVAAAGAFLVDADTRLNPGAGAGYLLGPGSGATAVAGGAAPIVRRPAEGQPNASKPANAEGTDATPPSGGADKPEAIVLAKPTADDLKNLDRLPAADRAAALRSKSARFPKMRWARWRAPVKVELAPGKFAFICCASCRDQAAKDPGKTIEKLARIERAVKEQTKQR